MEKPNIYVLKLVPVIGELMPPTEVKDIQLCERCDMRSHVVIYKNIHYAFDYWDGEDIIEGYQLYLVTDRLKNALETSQVKGIGFEKVTISKGEFFAFGSNAWMDVLPEFWQMIIQDRTATGPEVWWKRVPCNECEKQKWELTEGGILAVSFPFNNDPVPKRTVSSESWKGGDVFYLEDPGSPIVTEKTANILKQFNGEIHLLESGWV